jgi:hypothetical protein
MLVAKLFASSTLYRTHYKCLDCHVTYVPRNDNLIFIFLGVIKVNQWSMVSGILLANRREPRKLGLLRKQKF